jgi:hypothetical protein
MDSPRDPACAVGCPIRRSEDQRALAPPLGFSQRATSFIASRCQGIHQMPFMCRARAQPRARGVAACRGQHAEGRGQPKDAACCLLIAAFRSRCASTAPPMRARTGSTYPCPGPTSPRGAMAGPASRSRLASQCQKGRDQRSEIRDQITNRPSRTARASDLGLRHPSCANAIPTTRVPDDERCSRLRPDSQRSVARHHLTSDL